MSDWVHFEKDKNHTTREKEKAKKLKNSQWWKNRIAGGNCHYCRKKFPVAELTMDHIVPLARGGKSTKGNVVPCCKACNLNKKYYTPVDLLLQELQKKRESE